MHTVTKRNVTSLVVKLMAVYVLGTALRWIAYLPNTLGYVNLQPEDFRQFVAMLIVVGGTLSAILLFFVLGVIAIRKSDWVAERIVREDEIIGQMNRLSVDCILRIILIAIGLFMALSNAPGAIVGVFMLVSSPFSNGMANYHFVTSLGSLLSFLFGAGLILLSKRIATTIIRNDRWGIADTIEAAGDDQGEEQ